MEKYSRREKNRAKDFMHKLTIKIARELSRAKSGAILENLRGIKSGVLRKSKDLNRRLSKWNARTFQFMLEYKLKWLGLPVKHVNPKYSSKTCPLCQAEMSAYEGRLMKCKKCGLTADRDVVAILNLQMWGLGVAPKALLEALASMMGKRLVNQKLTDFHENLPTVNPRELDRHYIPSRYPNAHPSGTAHEAYDSETSGKALKCAQRIIDFVSKRLSEL